MLKAFTSAEGEPGNPELTYPLLDTIAQEAHTKEMPLQHAFYSAEEGSLEEEKLARSLAMGYMVLTADQLHKTKPEHQILLSDRYTTHTSELYGTPEEHVAKQLVEQQAHAFRALGTNPHVDQNTLNNFLGTLESMSAPESGSNTTEFSEVASQLKDVLYERFGEALAVFDAVESSDQEAVTPEDAASLFNEAIAQLAEQNPAWSDWHAKVAAGEGMSTVAREQYFKIGTRGNYQTSRLKALFGHEVLVHGLRSINGHETGDNLMQFGLPGNLDLEEGLGTMVEYALTGAIPDKNIDRYIDVSLALGQNGRPALTRQQLHELHTQRLVLRQQAAGKSPDYDKLAKAAWNHVDRIYRGSLGTEVIGVNTKDIAYYQGFLKAATYLKEELASKDMTTVYDYVMSGCFDPSDDRHRAYVQSLYN